MTLHFSPDTPDLLSRSHYDRQVPARPYPQPFYRRIAKQGFDLFLTVAFAPIVIPLLLLLAALIMLDGHKPLYSQVRIGRRGKTFRIWKLRTMVHDADARLESYLAENPSARLEWDATQKLKTDPRITLVGKLLRKTSLDELPQLWNVLKGDMSLVGPRPMMACQRKDYVGLSYYNLRPGITGLWQISDRNEGKFAGRVYYDDLYDQIVSFKTDLWILLRTVGVVVRGTGY